MMRMMTIITLVLVDQKQKVTTNQGEKEQEEVQQLEG